MIEANKNSDFKIENGILTFSDNCTKIKEKQFKGNAEIKKVIIGKNIISIGAHAFEGCENLESVSMAEGVKEIHEFAFKNCYSLETVSFPKTLIRVDNSAFGKTEDEECGMLVDEGCVKINRIFYSGPKATFYRVTNFQKIFVLDSNLSYSDMKITCSDGDIVFSNKTIDW